MKKRTVVGAPVKELNERTQVDKILRIKLDEKNLCLTKHGDRWLAFDEGCPHMGVSLAGGLITPFEEIVCPWHGFRFNIFDGKEAEDRCQHLQLYEVLIEGEDMIIIS